MMPNDNMNDDLAQQAMNLLVKVQSLKIGNSILRAELKRLQAEVATAEEAEAVRRKNKTAKTLLPTFAILAATFQQAVAMFVNL
jgi:hypothetical protein